MIKPVYTLVVQIMMTKNPLASYLCNCVAEVQRPVLGINRYVENSHKCNERQDLGLPEKKNKKLTLRSTSGTYGKIPVFGFTPFFKGGGKFH